MPVVIVGNQAFVTPADSSGTELAIATGTALGSTKALIVAGSDGTNARFLKTATDGTLRIDPTGTTTQPVSAASLPLPSGAATSANQTTLGSQTTKINDGTNTAAVTASSALKVDGSAVTQPVSGTVTANAGTGTFNNQQSNIQIDYDTGAGTQNLTVFGIALPANGGSVAGGTATNPLRTDPTGTTTQPISASSLPLPTGAATETTLASRLADATFTGRINTFGQKTMANSTPIVIASDQTVIPINDNAGSITVDGTVTSNQGTAASLASAWPIKLTDGTNLMPTMDAIGRAGFQKITDGTNTATVTASSALKVDGSAVTQPISAASLPLPTGAATSANQTTLGSQTTKINDGTNTAAVTASNALKVDGSAVTQPVSGTVTSNQGTAAALSGGWPVKITDGTNTMPTMDAVGRAGFQKVTDGTNIAAVKAASTAAAAADPSLVVALSPNSPLPAGTNTLGKADQGAAAALSGGWPVKVTDGTNTLPTMDVAARAAFVKQTDGTNLMPTADVAARALFSKITDGTNTMPTGDAIARGVFVRPTDGTNTQGYDANNHAFVAGKSAVGVTPTGNPIAVSGVDDGGLKRAWLTWTDGSTRILPNSQRTTLFNNGTITATGSQILSGLGMSEWYLVINLKNAPTGTTPTITFKIEAVDPIDQATVIDSTTTQIGVTHTTAGVEAIQFADNITDTVKITWTVTGTTPSWTGVNVTWVGHVAGNAIEGQAEVGQSLKEGPLAVAGVDNSNNVQVFKVDTSGALQVVVSNLPAGTTPGVRPGLVVLAGGTANTLNAIRGTAYTEQSSNAQRSVSSSSTNDTSAGTGARTITITYYDSSGAGPSTETITMNGTTAVNTVSTTICYIEKIEVVTVGSGGSNAGTITLWTTTGGGGTAIGTIGIGNVFTGVGDNKTLWAHHYIATGKTCNLTGFVFGATASSTFHLKLKALSANAAEELLTEVMSTAAEFQRTYASPPKITGPARIVAYGVPSTNGVTLNASMDFYDQ